MNRHPATEEFFENVRTAGFFARLFSWKKIQASADRAYQELQQSISDTERAAAEAAEEAKARETRYAALGADAERRVREAADKAAEQANECARTRELLAAESVRLAAEKERAADAASANAVLGHENESLKTALQEIKTELSVTAEKLAAEKERVSDAASANEALGRENENLQSTLQGIRTELSVTAEKLAAEKERVSEAASANEALGRENENLQSTLQGIRTELSVTAEKLAAERTGHEETKSAYEELIKSSSELQASLAETREKLSAAEGAAFNEREKYDELKADADKLSQELTEVKKQLAAEESVKEQRNSEYEQKITTLNTLIDQMNEDHERAEQRVRDEIEAHNAELATSWQRHEKEVEDTLRVIAKRYCITRCEKGEYPYQGTPDNVFYIGGMYTVFDAKSPKNPEDLANFPKYLREQAEKMIKYCKNENVRKDAFLVIPGSAADAVETFVYPLADYTVYVITLDAVLPILQMLKTLEAYDFAEQLSPEDRDKLCKYIGKLSHTAKRKVQIDTYLSQEFVSVLREASALPEEFAKEIERYEQQSKLNTPPEKRAKLIAIEDISSDVEQVERDILGWSRVEEHGVS